LWSFVNYLFVCWFMSFYIITNVFFYHLFAEMKNENSKFKVAKDDLSPSTRAVAVRRAVAPSLDMLPFLRVAALCAAFAAATAARGAGPHARHALAGFGGRTPRAA
jgi:hypothetical protein